MKRALVLVVLAGCFSKPEFTPGDAGASMPPGLIVEGRRVTWPPLSQFSVPGHMAIELGDPSAMVPMPTHLSVTGVNLIATPEGCGYEDRVGMSVYPMFAAAAVTRPGFVSALMTRASGPAFAQFEGTWTHPYSCELGDEFMASGTSTFSVFPDGRIVRVDTIYPTSQDIPAICTNSCESATDFYVTSHTAFEVSALQGAAAGTNLDDSLIPAVIAGSGAGAGAGGCVLDDGGGRVALRWDQRVNTTASSNRFRSLDNNGHRQVVFVADLTVGSTLQNRSHGIRTTMILDDENDSCTELQARAEQVATMPSLLINDVSVSAGADQVYRPTTAYDGPITIRSIADVPAGFVIAVELPGTTITTSRDPAGVIWHRDADGRFYIYFREFLNNGPTRAITITPG